MIDSSLWLVFTLGSIHADPNGMRQYNPGIGAEYHQWAAGSFINSFNKRTWYLGKRFDWEERNTIHMGLMLSGVTGYRSPVMPMPYVALEGRHFGANLGLLPDPLQWRSSEAALQIKWRF